MPDDASHAELTGPSHADHAERIAQAAAGPGGMVLLNRYFIGDDYEAECIASGLTVSPEHTIDVQVKDGELRCVTYFPPQMVPAPYRDRVNDGGVVPIALKAYLDDVTMVVLSDR